MGGRSIRRACPLLFPKNESVARGEGQQRTRVKSRGGCLTGHLRNDLQSGLSALAYGCCHMILSSSIFHSPMSLFGLLKEVAHPARRPAWETVDLTLGTAKAFKSFKTCTSGKAIQGIWATLLPNKNSLLFYCASHSVGLRGDWKRNQTWESKLRTGHLGSSCRHGSPGLFVSVCVYTCLEIEAVLDDPGQ